MPSKNICIVPWIGIETNSLGSVRPCCMIEDTIKNNDGTEMNLRENTLSEAFNSQWMQNLRQQFLNGEKPEICKKCWNEEDAGRSSKRMVATYNESYLGRVDPVDYSTLTPSKIPYIDLKLGNICNLACRICGGWSSSKLVKEEISYLPVEQQKEHPSNAFIELGKWPRNAPKFWEDLKTLVKDVKYFEITGGEPFLISHHFDILQYAVDHGYAKDIEIHYNTNGTTLPEHALDIWKHFRQVRLAFSIDNIGSRFEFERKNAVWKETLEVLRQVNEIKVDYPNIVTQMCLTINIQNVYYLEEIVNWMNAQPFDSTYFNFLHNPHEMNIAYMTPEAKELVINRLKNGTFNGSDQRHIDTVIQMIQNGPGSDGSKFRRRMKNADRYRGEDFSVLYPEMAKAMRYDQ